MYANIAATVTSLRTLASADGTLTAGYTAIRNPIRDWFTDIVTIWTAASAAGAPTPASFTPAVMGAAAAGAGAAHGWAQVWGGLFSNAFDAATAGSSAARLHTQITDLVGPNTVAIKLSTIGTIPSAQNAAITYLENASLNSEGLPGDIKTVNISGIGKDVLMDVGKKRFDTRFVRKLVLITNIERLLRLKLSQVLSQSHSVILTSHAAIAPGLTEYGYSDRFNANEVFGAQKYADSPDS